MDIALFGIQGSGKGTIARAVCAKYGFHYFETGGELRKLASQDSELAQKVKAVMESGSLVSNEIVMEIIEDFMNSLPDDKPIVFDGIPRKPVQATTFDALMEKKDRDFMGILVEVPEDMAMERLTKRRVCSKCKSVYPADYKEEACEKCGGELVTRSDDNPESIKTRFHAYFDETYPVIEKYKSEDKLITIDGTPDIETVRDNVFTLLEEKELV